MPAAARRLVAMLAAAALASGATWVLNERGDASAGDGVTPATRAATLRFAPDLAPEDRAWVQAAVRAARPEARRLIDEVDGMVTVGPMPPMGNAIGLTTQVAAQRYEIRLDVANLDGYARGDRATVVLHELGHVVDFALIDDATLARLNAGIPRTGSCGALPEPRGDCAAPAERFADTFAKWALHGEVSLTGSGYGVAAPASLEDWGTPLAALAAGLPVR
jgi:hypothetical protein